MYTDTITKFAGFHGYYSSVTMKDNVNRMHFVAAYQNVYISSAHSSSKDIDDTGSGYQYLSGADSYIDNGNLGSLFTMIQLAIRTVNGASS